MEEKIEETKKVGWLKKFLKFEITHFTFIGILLWFTMGVMWGKEIVDSFSEGNFRAGMNAAIAVFFMTMFLVNELSNRDIIKMYRKLLKISAEITGNTLNLARQILSEKNELAEENESLKIQLSGEKEAYQKLAESIVVPVMKERKKPVKKSSPKKNASIKTKK